MNNFAIQAIEEAILDARNYPSRISREENDRLILHYLRLRQRIMHEYMPFGKREQELLLEFNGALREAMSSLYDRAVNIFHELVEGHEDAELEASLWLDELLPKGAPRQDEHAQQLWEQMIDVEQPYYRDGVNGMKLWLHNGPDPLESKNFWLFLEEKESNWPDDLWLINQEWAKQQHLLFAVHNLAVHCHFSIFDLLYVREFRTEINIVYENDVPERKSQHSDSSDTDAQE